MKPTKNRKFCIDCMKPKMLFTSEKKAMRCIEMNGDEIYEASGYRPIRAYYCIACGGWHITSKELKSDFHSPVELYFMKQDEKNRAIRHLSEILPGNNFEVALKTRLGDLSRVVMRKKILKSQCDQIIHQLIDIFNEINQAQMVTELIAKYFNRFCTLCDVFEEKVSKGKLLQESQILIA